MTKSDFFITLLPLIKKYIGPHLEDKFKGYFEFKIEEILKRSSFINKFCIKLECTHGYVRNIDVFHINNFSEHNIALWLYYLDEFLFGNMFHSIPLSDSYSIHIIFYIGQFKYDFCTNELWTSTCLNILRDIFFNSEAFLSNTIADNYWS